MISKEMQDALNDQAAYEFHSAHLYLSMSTWLDSIDLPGAANWMRLQYQEEVTHAEKILDYVMERDGRALLMDWKAPKQEWDSALQAFAEAYAHEQTVTERFNKLMNLALEQKDHAAQIFLQWFVTEQVEEEATVKAIIQQFKLLGESKAGLFQLDRELGARTPSAAPAE